MIEPNKKELAENANGGRREVKEGKGRPELVPLWVMKELLESSYPDKGRTINSTLENLDQYLRTSDISFVLRALLNFSSNEYEHGVSQAVIELSKHYEEGAETYGDWNWVKLDTPMQFFSSALRHFIQYIGGDKKESHDRAFMWNLVGLMEAAKRGFPMKILTERGWKTEEDADRG